MSAYMAFSESRNVKLPEWTGQLRSGLLGVAVGLMLVGIAALIFIPADTFSTAVFYDELGVRQAVSGYVTYFRFINPDQPVSAEGFWFSVFVSLFNLGMAYQAGFGGFWFEDDPNSNLFTVIKYILGGSRNGPRRVNTIKVGYFFILVAITIFETWTGTDFRRLGPPSISGTIKAASVAFIVENVGSDWAFTAGIGMVLGGVLQVWDAWINGRKDIDRLRAALKRQGNPFSGNGSDDKRRDKQGGNHGRTNQPQRDPGRQMQRQPGNDHHPDRIRERRQPVMPPDLEGRFGDNGYFE